jgi:hypothetical protein
MKKPQLYVSLSDYKKLKAELEDMRKLNENLSAIANLPQDLRQNMENIVSLNLFWVRMQKVVLMTRQLGFGRATFSNYAESLVRMSWRKIDGQDLGKIDQDKLNIIDAYETDLATDIPIRCRWNREIAENEAQP